LITYKIIQGKEIQDYIDDIARLRIQVFREFPYLYDGDLQYEKVYLNKFSSVSEARAVIAMDGSKVVGSFTGLPMKNEGQEIIAQLPFDKVNEAFYLSEIVLDKTYRGKKIGGNLLLKLEEEVIKSKLYNRFYFATIVRPNDHPLKPNDYNSLDGMWLKNNYTPTPYTCSLAWKEIGEKNESFKELRIWEKEI
jgi:ribosomal protein S18 acetylase RimI-like enzyme